MTLRITREDPSQPEIAALLRDGEAHSATLYPPESRHQLPLAALRASNVRFLVARDESSHAVATGALVVWDDWADKLSVFMEKRRCG